MCNLNQFQIEKSSADPVQLSLLMLELAECIFLSIMRILCVVFRRHGSLISSQICFKNCLRWVHAEKKNQVPELLKQFCACTGEKKTDDGGLCREDVEMVMGSLGIFCHPEVDKLQWRFGSNDLSKLFEEKEPSLEEVKGAFDVFDENRDGFVDTRDLQRVLCVLGFKEGLEMDKCRNMIRAFDENGDGRIDFSEFVKFMENAIC